MSLPKIIAKFPTKLENINLTHCALKQLLLRFFCIRVKKIESNNVGKLLVIRRPNYQAMEAVSKTNEEE